VPEIRERAERRLAAVLAADVAGYSRLMGADEEGTLHALKEHRQVLFDPQIATHSGRVVKTTGDGLLLEFGSVVDAVDCACAIQRGMAKRNIGVAPDRRIEFRIGINVGDIIIDGGDIYGDGVNIAARLETLAEPGCICVSRAVRDELRDKRALAFQDLGEHSVKNIARPLRVYRLAPAADAVASSKDEAALAAAPVVPDRPSIAVLPFTNMSGDAEQNYFADGIVEDIITALSRFKELFVIARNSSFVYKGRSVDIQQVGRELGVRYVLEGSVRKAANRVRITGQLIDAATRTHLWADRFDGALEDVFDLQDRITEKVVGALEPTLRQAEIERARRKPPASLDAYDYLLRALPLVVANTVAEAGTAIKLLGEALRLYPDYAYAHALIATANGMIFRSAAGSEREESRVQAVAHARRAVALGGDDSAVLAPAGFMLLIAAQDVAGARAALDKAVALNPNSATALTYRALVLAIAGEPEPAIEDANHALRLSPLDPASYLSQMAIVVARIGQRRYDEAVAWARKAIEVNPRYPMSYAWLIVAECGRENAAEAERVVKQLANILPGFAPAALAKLFDMFPEPARSNAIAVLTDAGLVPAVGPG
jgi:TolB-like protein/class 3 adenylate cyclase